MWNETRNNEEQSTLPAFNNLLNSSGTMMMCEEIQSLVIYKMLHPLGYSFHIPQNIFFNLYHQTDCSASIQSNQLYCINYVYSHQRDGMEEVRHLLCESQSKSRWQGWRNQTTFLQETSHACLPLFVDVFLHRILYLVCHCSSYARDKDNTGAYEAADMDF